MSSYLGIDEGRQVLEIGGTYYRPKFRGTGFNRRVKDMMLAARSIAGSAASNFASTAATRAARRR